MLKTTVARVLIGPILFGYVSCTYAAESPAANVGKPLSTSSASAFEEPTLLSSVILVYAKSDKKLKDAPSSIAKVNSILKSNYLAKQGIETEKNATLRNYYAVAAQLMNSDYVVSCNQLINEISALPEFKMSPQGKAFKNMTDEFVQEYDDSVNATHDGDDHDDALIKANKIIERHLSPYRKMFNIKTNQTSIPDAYKYIRLAIIGGAYGDTVAVNAGVAMLASINQAKLSTKIKKESQVVNNEILAIRGEGF